MIDSQKIDNSAYSICLTLQHEGFQAYIVGGCVRDILLNTTPKDWDICTDATPEEVMKYFPQTYPTGLQHGTITVAENGNNYEVTTFRADGKYTDGRRPDNVSFVKDIKEDLLRRDFTINAIAYDPVNYQLIDPFNGIQDIQDKILRAVGNAVARFTEDSLRILRAARFASRLNYTIEHTTLTGMAVCSHMLENISKERIKDELVKILQTKKPSVGLQLIHDIDALGITIPNYQKNLQEFNNDLYAIDNCQSMYETRLAILFNDLNLSEDILLSMKFSNDEIKNISFILKSLNIMESIYVEWALAPQLPAFAIRKGLAFIKNTSPYGYTEGLNQFMKFVKAISLNGMLSDLEKHRNMLVWGKNELAISGKDLIEIGLQPGPLFKKMLEEAYTEIILNPDNNNKKHLIRFITSWLNPTNVIES